MAKQKERLWRGHVMAFDTHGYRVVRVALPESVVAQYAVGPQEPPDTRASSISRVETELGSDDFTMERGVWSR